MLAQAPGSASACDHAPGSAGPDEFTSMSAVQLRELVKQTPGIRREKKNEKGQCTTKTCKELKEELRARKNACTPVSDNIVS